MDSIVTLKSKTGVIKLPKTVGEAVQLTDGSNVQQFAEGIKTSMANHNHDDKYCLKAEVSELIQTTINGMGLTSTYTKSEINTFLNSKASISHNHDDMYYTKEDVYTKTEVESMIADAISQLQQSQPSILKYQVLYSENTLTEDSETPTE